MFHFPVYSATGVMWYLSAMMAAILLLLVFLPKHYNIFSSVIAPFIVLSIYGFLYSKFHSVAVILEPFDSDGMFCAGIFRALAGMGAGVISYRVSQYMSHVNFMSLGIKIITLVEFLSYAMAFGISVRLAGNTEYNFLMVLFIFVGITLSFSGKSYSAKWFSSDIFNKLGKFSLYIFLNHFYIALVLASMGMAHRDISMIIYLLGTLLCSNVAKFITDRIMSLEMYKMFIMPNK